MLQRIDPDCNYYDDLEDQTIKNKIKCEDCFRYRACINNLFNKNKEDNKDGSGNQ